MTDVVGLRVTRHLARLLLRLYPREFRRRWSDDFVDAAVGRWQRERVASHPAMIATLRTGLLLCADTLGAAPGAWRSAGSRGPSGSDRRDSLVERLIWSIAGSLADLRMALRLMRRQMGISALVVATLALGIGVSAAAFAALDRVVLNPLPFEHGDRMRYLALEHRVLGWRITPEGDTLPRWRQGAKTLERIETYRSANAVFIGDEAPERLNVLLVSTGLPGLLGVRPLAGRMLVEADAARDAPAVVMVHETFWRRKLGADPGIVGRDLRLTTGPATVIGIWPSRARLDQRSRVDVVRAMRRDQEIEEGGWTSVLALVRPGAADDAVASELDSLLSRNEKDGVSKDLRAAVVPPTGFVSDAYLQGLWLVFGAAAALLVVAILNAANLVLGRATTRGAELGVRLALGGSQARILRLFAAESLVLTVAGVAGGFVVAWLTESTYAAWAPAGLAAADGAWLDRRAAAFAGAGATVALLAGALAPALRARVSSVRDVLAGAGPRTTDATSRLRGVLVGAQAALAVLLVVGASITGRSFVRLASVHPGFDVDSLAIVSVSASPLRYTTPETQAVFMRQVREAIESLPQVERITITNAPPFSTSTMASLAFFEGEPEPSGPGDHELRSQSIDPAYFAVFGTPLVAGRLFEPADGGTAVIVNESFARAHGGDVLGRRLTFTGRATTWYTVVGIAGDVTAGPLAEGAAKEPQFYFPHLSGEEGTFARFVMRVTGDPAAAVAAARARVAAIDPLTPLSEARTVREIFDGQTSRHRFIAYLLGGLALFGVVFAVSGVYGVVTLEVARRRREVGLRVALGATATDVIGYMVRRGLRPVLVGAALGVTASLALGPYLKDLLFRVSERDPFSAAAGVGIVVATAAIGCALPARRAARVDPVVALRAE